MYITFNSAARLQIAGIMNDKAKGKGYDTGFICGANLYDKIVIPDEVQMECSTKQEDGTFTVDPVAILNLPDIKVDLDHNELSKLEKVLTDFDGLRPVDRRMWWANIMKQIEDAKKPELEPVDVRTERLEARKRK